MSEFETLILALYRAVRPKCRERTHTGWFLGELHKRGVEVGRTQYYRWLKNGVPASREPEVGKVLGAIHKEAHAALRASLATLEGVL